MCYSSWAIHWWSFKQIDGKDSSQLKNATKYWHNPPHVVVLLVTVGCIDAETPPIVFNRQLGVICLHRVMYEVAMWIIHVSYPHETLRQIL